MNLSGWFDKLFRPASGRQPARRPNRRRPTVEILEDRIAPATLTVQNLNDDGPSDTQDLRSVLSHAAGGDIVDFKAGLQGVINVNKLYGTLVVPSGVTLIGPGNSLITVSGANLSNEGTFLVDPSATIEYLTISDSQPSQAAVTLSSNDLLSNDVIASNGGFGVINGTGSSSLVDSLVANNKTTLSGDNSGGVYNNAGTLVVFDSTVEGNSASTSGYGGGITNTNGGVLQIENSTIAGNTSTYGGGGILTDGGVVGLLNATVANNQTNARGGGIELTGSNPALYLINTIVATNTATGAGPDLYSSGTVNVPGSAPAGWSSAWGTLNNHNNLIGNDSGSPITSGSGDLIGTLSSPVNPLLGHLADNGGPTPTLALLPGSPAINAGDTNFVPDTYDQRGSPYLRIYPSPNGPVDIGAFEYSPLSPVAITPTTLPAASLNTSYSQQLSATGGNGNGYTFRLVSGTLPTGLSLNLQGKLDGTPTTTTGSPFTFTISATDSSGNSGSQAYTLAVDNGLAITPSTLPTAIINTTYNAQLSPNGAGYTYTYTGSLPPGITFNGTTGDFSGTPTQTGTFGNIQVSLNGGAASQTYSITVNAALSLTPASGSLPAATTNSLYTATFTGAGGSGSGYTYSESGALPAGLTFNNGVLSGTPNSTSGSPFSFTVTVTDSASNTATNNYTLIVETPITIPTPATLPTATVGDAYNQTTAFSATGGSNSGFTYFETGTLPLGVSFDSSTDKLIGTPTQSGTFTILITATDSNGGTGSQSYTLTVNPALTLSSPATLPTGTVNNLYPTQTLTPTGGSGSNYTLTVSGLPTGLTFDSANDTIAGTPSQYGTFTVTVGITDSIGATGSVQYSLVVNPALSLGSTPTPLPYAAENGPYSATITATGGSGTGYVYSFLSGSLPPGITFNNGQLTGAATVGTGTYTFTVGVQDSQGGTTSQSFTINVEGPITLTPATLPTATVNNAYNQTTAFVATGGSNSGFTYSETGTLPPGMSFDSSTDKLIGTPTTTTGSPYAFTISATDSHGGTGSQSYSLTVDPALTLSPATLPNAALNSLYSQTIAASGGSGVGYQYTSSTLPSWLTLNPTTGVLTGTDTNSADVNKTFNFSITATDSVQGTTTQAYSLTVNPALALGPTSLPNTAETDTYYFPLTATGGSGSGYTFSVTAGTLPTGLGFSGNVLTGVVTASPSTYHFTVTLTDSQNATTSQNYSIIVGPPISLTPTTLPAGILDKAYTSTTISASGGSGSGYVFSETGGPAGLAINSSTGVLAGTPTQYGTFAITITVSDSKGGSTSQPYSLVIGFSLGNSANALFVDAVYQKLLNRAPDPGAQGWVTMLNNGAAPSTIVSDVEQSTEYLSDVVAGIYEHYLNRAPDPGAVGWVQALANGASIEQVTASIVASQEFYNDSLNTNIGFVKNLYQDILNRSADAAGLSAWLAFLNAGGSRYQAALGFLTSTEYETDLVAGYGWTPASGGSGGTGGYYLTYLGRQGDAAGVAGWVQALQSGLSDQVILAAIFGSAEGYTKNS